MLDSNDIVILDRRENGVCKSCLIYADFLMSQLKTLYPNRNIIFLVAGNLVAKDVLKILSKASILIAPHGAGLIHMLLLPPGASVIEVFNRPGPGKVFCFANFAPRGLLAYMDIDGNASRTAETEVSLILREVAKAEKAWAISTVCS